MLAKNFSMDISSTLPLGISAARYAVGGAKSLSDSLFSQLLYSQEDEVASPKSMPSGLSNFFSGTAESDHSLQSDLVEALEELNSILDRYFFRSGQALPDAYSLSIGNDGEVAYQGDERIEASIQSVIERSPEARSVLQNITALASQLQEQSRQARFSETYQQDPQSAWDELNRDRDKPSSLSVDLVGGKVQSVY